MTIILDLSHDLEARVREHAARGNADAVHRLLVEALGPVVESLIRSHGLPQPSHDDSELLTDQLTESFMDCISPNTPPLSDDAVSRHGLYEDHL